MANFSQQAFEFKVPFVGNANVGKTSIVTRYVTGKFNDSSVATIGVSNVQIPMDFKGQKIIINAWDTAGEEKYRSLTPLYTRGAYVIILVFAVDDVSSYDSLNYWFQRLRDDLGHTGPILVCANKADLTPAVLEEQIQNWAKNHDCELFFTSASTGQNITHLFQEVANLVASRTQIEINEAPLENKKESQCC